MKIKTVSDCIGLDAGTPIPMVTGYIDRVYDRKVGQSQYGKYSFENFMLEGDDGQKIRVTLKNLPQLQFGQGDQITIIAKESDRGWSGVERKDDEYKGEVRPAIVVSSGARICLASELEDAEEPSPRRSAPAPSRPAPARVAANTSIREDAPEEFSKRLVQAGNCYLRAYGTAHMIAIAAEEAGLPRMEATQIQAATFTIFKEAMRPTTLASMPSGEVSIAPLEDGEGDGEDDYRPAPQKRRGGAPVRQQSATQEEWPE